MLILVSPSSPHGILTFSDVDVDAEAEDEDNEDEDESSAKAIIDIQNVKDGISNDKEYSSEEDDGFTDDYFTDASEVTDE